MEKSGKIIQILPLQNGIGKNGPWSKQDIIIETEEKFVKKLCVSIWGDKIIENQLVIGNKLKINFEIESREFNGKWYTDIKATKIEVLNVQIIEPIKPVNDIIFTPNFDKEENWPF